MMNKIQYYKHPVLFYFLSISIPSILWVIAAYISHLENPNNFFSDLEAALMLISLASPAITAFMMMYFDNKLRDDLFTRIFNFTRIKPGYIALTFLLMPASILLAQTISLFFEYSIDQFKLSYTSSVVTRY